MTDPSLSEMTVEELLEQFAINGIAQDEAILASEIPEDEFQDVTIQDDEIDEFTRLFWEMDAINKELLARGGETQLALLRLYGHPNMQVRLQAAKLTMTTAPIAARAELEAIKNSRHFPQAGDAGMTLSGF